jgi:hypothetical protein
MNKIVLSLNGKYSKVELHYRSEYDMIAQVDETVNNKSIYDALCLNGKYMKEGDLIIDGYGKYEILMMTAPLVFKNGNLPLNWLTGNKALTMIQVLKEVAQVAKVEISTEVIKPTENLEDFKRREKKVHKLKEQMSKNRTMRGRRLEL